MTEESVQKLVLGKASVDRKTLDLSFKRNYSSLVVSESQKEFNKRVYEAIEKGDPEKVEKIISSERPRSGEDVADVRQRISPAVDLTNRSEKSRLLEDGIVVDDSNFVFAVSKNKLEIVRILLDRGVAKITHEALNVAIKKGLTRMVEILLESEYPFYLKEAGYLEIASKEGHFEVVKFLVRCGTKVTAKAIESAVLYRHMEIFDFLLQNGGGEVCDQVYDHVLIRLTGELQTRVNILLSEHFVELGDEKDVELAFSTLRTCPQIIERYFFHKKKMEGLRSSLKWALKNRRWKAAELLLRASDLESLLAGASFSEKKLRTFFLNWRDQDPLPFRSPQLDPSDLLRRREKYLTEVRRQLFTSSQKFFFHLYFRPGGEACRRAIADERIVS